MSKNDERVLQLKKLIETKKSELSTQRFVPKCFAGKRIGIFNGKTKCICNVC